jgi:hypothetical protein
MSDCFFEYEWLPYITPLVLLKQCVEAAGNDPRLGSAHICLYTALMLSERMPGTDFVLRKYGLMRLSGIRSTATYYRCMKDLREFGYVWYYPSLDPHGASKVLVRYRV